MGEPCVKVLWIKPEYLSQILGGRKTIEVRAAYHNITRLRVGDVLKLNDTYLYEIVTTQLRPVACKLCIGTTGCGCCQHQPMATQYQSTTK
jgi:hypothetical protein